VGVWAQFEEKEYETLANAALVIEQARRGRGVRLFSPGQALEKILGYDFATRVDPRSRLYRRLFGAAPALSVFPLPYKQPTTSRATDASPAKRIHSVQASAVLSGGTSLDRVAEAH